MNVFGSPDPEKKWRQFRSRKSLYAGECASRCSKQTKIRPCGIACPFPSVSRLSRGAFRRRPPAAMPAGFRREFRTGLYGTGSANCPRKPFPGQEQHRRVLPVPKPSRWKRPAPHKPRRLRASNGPWRQSPRHHSPERECRGLAIRCVPTCRPGRSLS